MSSIDILINKAAEYIISSQYAIALTGAGISTESGIPDFRGQNGLWRRINPYYATYTYFIEDPEGFWKLYLTFVRSFREAEPNPAHIGLARLEKLNLLKVIITQNIDGLHQKAGSRNVIELHGNLRTISCTRCGYKYTYDEVFSIIEESSLPPRCKVCNGILKPDVVLFGEPLPYTEISKAYEEASKADLILVLGSSLTVYPAAYIPETVKMHGGKVIIINMEPTEKDHIAEILINAKVGEVVPRLVESIENML